MYWQLLNIVEKAADFRTRFVGSLRNVLRKKLPGRFFNTLKVLITFGFVLLGSIDNSASELIKSELRLLCNLAQLFNIPFSP
jgi:hypothetical protein